METGRRTTESYKTLKTSKYNQLSDELTCAVFEYVMELGLNVIEILNPCNVYYTDKGRIDLVTKWLDVEPIESEITVTAKRMIDDIANSVGDGKIYHVRQLIHIVKNDGLWLDLDRNRCRLASWYYPEVMAK